MEIAGSLPLAERARRLKTRIATAYAVRSGRIIKPSGCETCGQGPIQAHHLNYDDPLQVKWLCRPHHLAAHGRKPVVRTAIYEHAAGLGRLRWAKASKAAKRAHALKMVAAKQAKRAEDRPAEPQLVDAK